MSSIFLSFYGYKIPFLKGWAYRTRRYAIASPDAITLPEGAEMLYAYELVKIDLPTSVPLGHDVVSFDDALHERRIHGLTFDIYESVELADEALTDKPFLKTLEKDGIAYEVERGNTPVPWVLVKWEPSEREGAETLLWWVWGSKLRNNWKSRLERSVEPSNDTDSPTDNSDIEQLFNPSNKNPYDEVDGFEEEPYLRAERAATAIAEYMNVAEYESVSTRKLLIKGYQFQATTYRFERGNDCCYAEFSMPTSFEAEVRLWADDQRGNRVWASLNEVLDADWQDELFSFLGGYWGDFGKGGPTSGGEDNIDMAYSVMPYTFDNSPFSSD